VRFTKAHGTGNDFVVLADLDDTLALPAGLVRALTDRRLGIGADGVLRIGGPRDGGQVFMDYRNADGSIVEMCGNGVRVVAKHVVDHGLVAPDADDRVLIGTRAGVKAVTVIREDGRVVSATVDMGPPILEPAQVPFVADGDGLEHDVDVDGARLALSVVSMGNPHAVLLTEDVDTAPVARLGPMLEHHERFPNRVNVGFVEPVDRSTIRLRVWERGVGETLACGTGACAAVVALQRLDVVDEDVEVRLPGGSLQVRHTPGGTVWMTGPAVEVASGELDDAWLAAAGGAD
jgi:diaminopimelate epimerase